MYYSEKNLVVDDLLYLVNSNHFFGVFYYNKVFAKV